MKNASSFVMSAVILSAIVAACGGNVVFVAQSDGGLGGAGGQGGAGQGSGPVGMDIVATSTVVTTGPSTSSVTPSCAFPSPVGTLSQCGGTGSGGMCLSNYCDSGDGATTWASSCQGTQCTCTYTDDNAQTTTCPCTANGDVCSGAQSCCPFAF